MNALADHSPFRRWDRPRALVESKLPFINVGRFLPGIACLATDVDSKSVIVSQLKRLTISYHGVVDRLSFNDQLRRQSEVPQCHAVFGDEQIGMRAGKVRIAENQIAVGGGADQEHGHIHGPNSILGPPAHDFELDAIRTRLNQHAFVVEVMVEIIVNVCQSYLLSISGEFVKPWFAVDRTAESVCSRVENPFVRLGSPYLSDPSSPLYYRRHAAPFFVCYSPVPQGKTKQETNIRNGQSDQTAPNDGLGVLPFLDRNTPSRINPAIVKIPVPDGSGE